MALFADCSLLTECKKPLMRKQPRYTEDMVSTACEEAELFDGVPQNQAHTLERMTDEHTQKIVGSGDRRTREVSRRICGVRLGELGRCESSNEVQVVEVVWERWWTKKWL